jgi:hypothetical protein
MKTKYLFRYNFTILTILLYYLLYINYQISYDFLTQKTKATIYINNLKSPEDSLKLLIKFKSINITDSSL